MRERAARDGARRRLRRARRRRAAADAAHDRPRPRARRATRSCCCSTRSPRRCRPTSAERVFAVMRDAARAGPLGALHHAPARRGDRDLRPRDGPARRRATLARSSRRRAARSGSSSTCSARGGAGARPRRRRPRTHATWPPARERRRRSLEVDEPRSSAVDGDVGFTLRVRRDPRHRRARRAGTGRPLRRPLRAAFAGRRRDRASHGKRCSARHPYDAIRAGLVLVPADRLQALLPQRSVTREHRRAALQPHRRWGPINMRGEGRRVRKAVEALQIDTRAAAPGAAALGRQPAEGDDRALARAGLRRAALLRPDARHRRRHEAPDLRAPAQLSPTTARRSCSSPASWPSSRSSATA